MSLVMLLGSVEGLAPIAIDTLDNQHAHINRVCVIITTLEQSVRKQTETFSDNGVVVFDSK